MTSKKDLQKYLISAIKNRDIIRANALRLVLASVRNIEIEKGALLSDKEIFDVFLQESKKIKDSIDQFNKAGRSDLVAKEKINLSILMEFLPKQLSKEEIQKTIDSAISKSGVSEVKDMGKVMSVVMAELKSQADGGLVSVMVKNTLIRLNGKV